MRVLLEVEAFFSYGFASLDTGVGTDVDLGSARGGQANGVLGAAEPGLLSMVIGMHSGRVPVRIELHESAPVIEGGWDDVVEASVDARGPDAHFATFDQHEPVLLPANGWYRARWYDQGADAGHEHERYDSDEPVVERCLLQLWQGPPAPDAVLRESSAHAAYWRAATTSYAPPPPPEVRAYAEYAAHLERVAREEQSAREWERRSFLERWGGRDPSPRLLEVEQEAVPLTASGRRGLVDDLADLAADVCRALAVDLAEQACAAARDVPFDWQPLVAALRGGGPLPPPFDDPWRAYAVVFGHGEPTWTAATFVVSATEPPLPREPVRPASAAVGAVLAAVRVDPLAAALGTVQAVSTSAPDLDVFFAEIGRRVRALRETS